jgi:hypothetical protein
MVHKTDEASLAIQPEGAKLRKSSQGGVMEEQS